MNNREEWVNQFEALTGRKPTAAEYVQAKETNFDLSQIAAIAGLVNPSQTSETGQVPGALGSQEAVENVAESSPQSVQSAIPQSAQADQEDVKTLQGKWVSQFEALTGRKPTPDEYMQAKETNFDLAQVTAIAGLANPSQTPEAGQAIQPNMTQQQIPFTGSGQMPQQPQVQNFQHPAFQPANMQMPGQVPTKPTGSGMVLNLILPIVSLVLSVIFAGLSFTGAAPVFLGLAFLGLIFAIVLLVINLKSQKKLLSIIAAGVAAFAVLISIGGVIVNISRHSSESTPASTEQGEKSGAKVEDDSDDADDYVDKNYKFEWKKDEVEDIKVDDDTVADVVSEYGKASAAKISDKSLVLRYEDSSDEDSKQSVAISFVKEHDGTWVVRYVDASLEANDIDVSGDSYKSDWTKSDFDALKEGDYSTGEGGTSWSEIKGKHDKPSEAYYTFSNYGDGDTNKGLTVYYIDFDTDDSHADYVSLDFVLQDDGKTYKMNSKYGSGAGISND
ncbi:hypothetical protein ACVR1G_06005 [Streptococcus dentasini]